MGKLLPFDVDDEFSSVSIDVGWSIVDLKITLDSQRGFDSQDAIVSGMLFVPGEKRPYVAAQSYKMKVSDDADKDKIGPNKHDVTSRELVWWKMHT